MRFKARCLAGFLAGVWTLAATLAFAGDAITESPAEIPWPTTHGVTQDRSSTRQACDKPISFMVGIG